MSKIRNVVAVVVLLASGVAISACQPQARPGHRCSPEGDSGIGAGWDQANTYQCRVSLAIQAAHDAKGRQDYADWVARNSTTTTTAPPALHHLYIYMCTPRGRVSLLPRR